MWFKSITPYQFNTPLDIDGLTLHNKLSAKPFKPCSATQRDSMGWVAPLGKQTMSLAHQVDDAILITLHHQQKVLPASVVNDHLQEKVDLLELEDGRNVSTQERRKLKEDIELELLPKAFVTNTRIDAWINVRTGMLFINNAATSTVDMFTHVLRATLGTLPISPILTEPALFVQMQHWLIHNTLKGTRFNIGHECEMSDNEGATAKFSKHDLWLDEVQNNLLDKNVTKIQVEWSNKISCVVSDDYVLRKLKFLDVDMPDQSGMTVAEEMTVQFAIMAGEVSQMFQEFKRLSL